MDREGRWPRTPLAAAARTGTAMVTTLVLLLGASACGGGDDPPDGGAGLGDRSDTNEVGEDKADGGDASGGSGPPARNPCELLEIAEIEAQLGEGGAVADGIWADQGPAADVETCSWDIGNPPDSGGFVILNLAHRQGDPLVFEGPFVGDPVDGLGDEAYAHSSPAGTGLDVISGDWYVDLSGFLYPDPADLPDRMLTLTQHILDRL